MLVLVASSTNAQSSMKLSGRVVDFGSDEPLEYASISLKGRAVGTVTNSDGRFDFYLPPGALSDTVMVSFLGYSPFFAIASQLSPTSDSIIRLKSKALVLNQVVVRDKTPTGMEIITMAFRSVEANYPTEPYLYTGFIREAWTENSKTISLVESAVDIYDDGYRERNVKSVKVREKVDLKFTRSSDNNMNAYFRPYLEQYNSLTAVLRWNQVKYPHPDVIGNLKTKDVILEDVVYANDRVLYVVSFISHSAANKLFERKDRYYIDAQSFAIRKIEWREYSRNGRYRGIPWSVDSVRSYQARDVVTTYEFEEFNGKMYLKYYREHGEADIYNTKTKVVEYELEGDAMFVVTEVMKNTNAVKPNDTMDHNKSLSLQTIPYDESFWTNYDQVKLVPLADKQVRDLETTESLNKQFVRSGLGQKRKK
jgi:CarboxypepD_reg-like domain